MSKHDLTARFGKGLTGIGNATDIKTTHKTDTKVISDRAKIAAAYTNWNPGVGYAGAFGAGGSAGEMVAGGKLNAPGPLIPGDKITMLDRNKTISDAAARGDTTETGAGSFAGFEGEKYVSTVSTQSTPALTLSEIKQYDPLSRYSIKQVDSFSGMAKAAAAAVARNATEWTTIVDKALDATPLMIQAGTGAGGPANRYETRFVAEPQSAEREPRTTWAELQKALQHRIIPNELYEKDGNEYELTTYNITLFMIEEGRLFKNRLNTFSQEIKTIEDIEALGGIILAQSAGTDEFYIENLSFKTGVGGPHQYTTQIEFGIRSPYQADFVDYIFKAAQQLKIRNHTDFPTFLLIEWRGRHAENSKPTVPTTFTSRCYAIALRNMDLIVDESGGTYGVQAIRASERGLGQDKILLKKDITISGKTIGDVLLELTRRLQSSAIKGERSVLVPDTYHIEIPAAWRNWPLKSAYEVKYSTVSSNTNGSVDVAKSTHDVQVDTFGRFTDDGQVKQHVRSADSSSISKSTSQKHLNESEMVRTFTFKSGTDIITVIQSVLNTSADFQKLIVGGQYDPQDPAIKGKGRRSSATDIWKYYVKVDVDVEYIGYDKNTRQYSCKRIFQVIQNLDPMLGADETTTQQTKEGSEKRLNKMLNSRIIEKAYLYYYTGLNTEIKNLELNFDNHYLIAKDLYSSKGSMEKKRSGTFADPDTGTIEGATSIRYNALHDDYEQQIETLMGDIESLDTKIEATQQLKGYEDDRAFSIQKAATAKKKVIEAEVQKLEEHRGYAPAQLIAQQKGELEIHKESQYTYDADRLMISAGRPVFQERVPKIFTPSVLRYAGDLQKKSNDGVLFPVKFTNTSTPTMKTGTNEEAHIAGNIVSEIMAQRKGSNMIQINLELRGDPYWLPKTISGINLDSISPAHQQPMLIIIASQGSDYNNAGLFQVNERNSISAVYNVINVVNTFSGGEFTQTLLCSRDAQIDINAVLRNPDKFIEFNERMKIVEHTELTGGDTTTGRGWE
jgi:hypothetical protein